MLIVSMGIHAGLNNLYNIIINQNPEEPKIFKLKVVNFKFLTVTKKDYLPGTLKLQTRRNILSLAILLISTRKY
jgi:hypothetical protein